MTCPGQCNMTSGACDCHMMFNPFNSSQPFSPWAGDDCSFLPAYSGATRHIGTSAWAAAIGVVLLLYLLT